MYPAQRLNPEQVVPAPHESAISLAITRIPLARSDQTVADARQAFLGCAVVGVGHLVVIDHGRFVGAVALEKLLTAHDGQQIGEIIDPDFPRVLPDVDQEVAAWHVIRHDASALAVVDENDVFLGLIPARQLLGVMLQEHDEDLSRLGGFLKGSRQARQSSEETVVRRFRHRIPWLLVGIVGALLSADIVSWFEAQLATVVMIAFFVPGVVYLADAVGTQTETVVVRGLSVGVPMRRMAVREILVGLFIGLSVALISWALVWLRWQDFRLALAVGIALFFACAIASSVALLLPWLFSRAGVDPAFGAGPLATVVQDLLSIMIYFVVVTWVMTGGAG